MSDIEKVASAISEKVPTAAITINPDALRNYTVEGILPRLVVTPKNVEQISQVVALANEQNLKLLARGGGSRINLGGIPDHIDIVLETSKLTRLLQHEAADLTCHLEAGLTLAALQTQLATKDQWLALDPPNAEQATIGGILASNASGPKRLHYGTARDQVISLHIVQANGEIAHTAGNIVKNVASHDLNKLYIGSLGTLGIIVEANFKLQPLPPAERTLLLTFTNAADAMRTVSAVIGSLLTPSAIELIDPGAASDMNNFFGLGLNLPTNGYTLAIDFEGNSTTIDRQVDEVRLLARTHNALMADDLFGQEQDHFWNAVREHMQGTVTCKAAILVSQVARYLETVERVCHHHELEAAIITHAGNGIIYIELRPSDASQRLINAILELRLHAQEARGSLVIERCPMDLKRRISVWGEPGSDFYLMQQLKLQFDPKGTFVKGRFVGGL